MAEDEEEPGSERRKDTRSRSLLSGKVVVGDARFSADCAIIDLSTTGARIRISPDANLGPPLALLVIRDGRLFEAVVAWRRQNEAGLVFNAERDLGSDHDPARARIRALWIAAGPGAAGPGETDL